jgi:hypothetical protein
VLFSISPHAHASAATERSHFDGQVLSFSISSELTRSALAVWLGGVTGLRNCEDQDLAVVTIWEDYLDSVVFVWRVCECLE